MRQPTVMRDPQEQDADDRCENTTFDSRDVRRSTGPTGHLPTQPAISFFTISRLQDTRYSSVTPIVSRHRSMHTDQLHSRPQRVRPLDDDIRSSSQFSPRRDTDAMPGRWPTDTTTEYFPLDSRATLNPKVELNTHPHTA